MKKGLAKNILILAIVLALSGSQLYVPPKQLLIPSTAACAKTPAKKLTQRQAAKKLTQRQAAKKLVKWLKKKKLYHKEYVLTYNQKKGKKYLFHYFEDMGTHTATVNWYYVHSITGKITSMF